MWQGFVPALLLPLCLDGLYFFGDVDFASEWSWSLVFGLLIVGVILYGTQPRYRDFGLGVAYGAPASVIVVLVFWFAHSLLTQPNHL